MHALVLAAGRSERMGKPKPLLLWLGEPLLVRVVRALGSGGARSVRVVVSDPDVAALAGDRAVWNPCPERGMLSSVQCGLATLPAECALLVCPCDLPLLTAEPVRQIIAAWNGDPEAIVVPTFGFRRGHPTLFGPEVARRISQMDPQREGLNALVRRCEAGMVTVETEDPGPILDADTPEEWAELAAREGIEHAVE